MVKKCQSILFVVVWITLSLELKCFSCNYVFILDVPLLYDIIFLCIFCSVKSNIFLYTEFEILSFTVKQRKEIFFAIIIIIKIYQTHFVLHLVQYNSRERTTLEHNTRYSNKTINNNEHISFFAYYISLLNVLTFKTSTKSILCVKHVIMGI